MNYVCEVMTPENHAKVIADSGKEFSRLYSMRHGYFKPPFDYQWAVDSQANSYLLAAPMMDPMRTIPTFHFYFKNQMYSVELHGVSRVEIRVAEALANDDLLPFRSALVAAFEAFRLIGYRHLGVSYWFSI